MRGTVYKRGSTWTVQLDLRSQDLGQPKKGGFRTKKEADAHLATMIRAAERGIAVAPDRLTASDYLDEWVTHRESMGSLKPSTVQSYRSKIRLYVTPSIGTIVLQRLTAIDLDRMYRLMADNGLSPRTIRYVHSIVHKALHDAERQNLVVMNVARRANPPSSKSARAPKFRVWTSDELATFLAYIEGHEQALALRFAAFTGIRRGEISGLRWDDLDLEEQTATIRHNVVELQGGGIVDDTPKNHRERAVALDRDVVARLRQHRVQQAEWRLLVGAGWRDNGLVFCGPDGDYLRPDVIGRRFRSYVRSAGLPPIRLHDLRHGHATGLVEAGVDPATVASRLGHATTQFTLDVYVKPSRDRQAEAAEAFAARIAKTS